MKIILDAMGGDYAPHEIIEGAKLAKKELNIDITLVGREDEIRKYLTNEDNKLFEIIHAEEIVTMEDKPVMAFRRKKDSSINKGLNLLKDGLGDAFVSAGNTGAILTSSYFILGKIKDYIRPTQSAIIPTLKGFLILVDAGANIEANTINLLHWAQMGKVFSKILTNKEKIKIGLLNIGEEEEKGNDLTKEVYKLFKQHFVDEFAGNMEGKDFLYGDFDLCVTDGFTGNIALKTLEGEASLFLLLIKNIFKKNILTNIAYLLVKNEFKKNFEKFNYEKYGGSPILGVNGTVIVCHGRSKRVAIKNAIKMAKHLVELKLVDSLKSEFD
ncbi:MAG: phosphate acyltransferase PlsX [Caldisericia bacterium]|nr:phosphate acyltransferase PlsX [Caldisericia bacterium]